jgi:alpha-L-rhamnosidase
MPLQPTDALNLLIAPQSKIENQKSKMEPPPALWPAAWIIHASAFKEPTGLYLFRRKFDLPAAPASFPVRVTADNRYQLFVNGRLVDSGPARGDVPHWRYRTVELAPYLQAGHNVIAAAVWYIHKDLGPWAQMSYAPGFLLCGEPGNSATQAANTPNGWKCIRNPGHTFPPGQTDTPYGTVVGPGEHIDATVYPWGWEQLDFDDSQWDNPHRMANGTPRGARDGPGPWNLVPDALPVMEEKRLPVTAVVRSEGVMVKNHRLADFQPIIIPAHTKATLLFDNTVLTTGYPELNTSVGRGATVRMRYSEALFEGPAKNQKTNRNKLEGMVCKGNFDSFILDGKRRAYRPLWWRTFRYLQVEVETQDEPVVLHNLTNIFTAYPFTEKGRFSSSDDSLKKIWEVSWRTARLCAHETYMDCPYYEQLQYGGDTRIQCLVSLYVSGDDRLMRNAITQLDDSRIPDGITQSRYPSFQTQIIPPFSLWWIGMIHDHWMFRDDPAFIKGMLPGTRTTLQWFLDRLDTNGLLGPLPWWNFVDWARVFPSGVPPGANEGGSSILSLQVALALRECAEMEEVLGHADVARRYRADYRRIIDAVRRECWDANRGLLADSPKKDRFSQHANILGILTDALTGKQARAVAEKIETDEVLSSQRRLPADKRTPIDPKLQIAQATFYFRFYLHRALRKVGLGDHYLHWLKPWHDMLAIGLTTWAEEPEPTRSDCHAWSAHPNVDLLATVLGVEPAAPGFKKILIAPHLGELQWAEGLVPHPNGEIEVKLRKEGRTLNAEITLPPNTTGTFRYAGNERNLIPGLQSIIMEHIRM